MNTKQIQYVLALSETLNFSMVAEQLGISQPALSKQIIGLEQELGVRLFDRSTTPLTITAAGAHFVQEAKELLFREDQLKRSMQDFATGGRGRLLIGISPFRSMYLIPSIVKQVRNRYPGVQVVLHEVGSDQLRKEAAEGKYDFAIVNLPVDESVLDVTPLESDTLVLAVPNELVAILGAEEGQEIDFADCKEMPFVVVGHSQEMRKLFDRLCASANLKPQIAAEVVGVSTAWAMARAGVGATLLPLQFVKADRFDQRLTLFTLKNNIFTRQPVVVTRRGQYLSECARFAIGLLANRE